MPSSDVDNDVVRWLRRIIVDVVVGAPSSLSGGDDEPEPELHDALLLPELEPSIVSHPEFVT